EQAILTRAVVRLEAGRHLDLSKRESVARVVEESICSERLCAGATRFAARYSQFDSTAAINEMIDDVLTLLPSSALHAARHRVQQCRDANELIHWKRFDVMAKVLYAQHRVWGLECDW